MMEERGDPAADRLRRPPLARGLDFFVFAFEELSTCRPPGFMGLLPIPWTAIQAFADAYGMDDEATDTFRRMIRAADAAWMERARGKSTEAEA